MTATVELVDYAPRGPHRDLFRAFARAATDPYAPPPPAEVLIEGPAGTAKSRNALEIINFLAETIEAEKPWRALLLRKTRVSLNDSVLFTLEDEVWWPGHPMLDGASREHRSRYIYPNGNQLVLGGMDNPTKLFSTQYDLIYINEGNELKIGEYESLFRALRNFAVSWQSILIDCNPDVPGHWLNQRPEKPGSAMERVRTRHRDNPMLFFPDGVTRTARGEVYMKRLDQLSGVRRLRLRDGIWAAAEGQVWENFDPAVHVVDAGSVDPNDTLRPWGRNLPPFVWYLLSQDFGFRDAQVLQLWGVTKDRRAYRLRERYRTTTGLLWWTDTAVDWIKETDAIRMVCDHRPELIQMLNDRLGFRGGHDQAPVAIPAAKGPGSIEAGTDLVREMLGNEQGREPRVFFVRDGRDPVRDPVLLENHLPTCTEDEIPGYVWLEHRDGQPVKNRPDPSCQDHGCFVAGTMVRTPGGEVPIEAIRPGDLVCTPNGPEIVVDCGMTMADAEVWALTLEDGRELIGTPDHPVWVNGYGMVRLDAIRYGDTISSWIQPSTRAKGTTLERPAWIRKFASAEDVASRSSSIAMPAPGSARVGVVGVRRLGRAAVFNLTVEPTHAYFANGVLVSNCDATRYALMYIFRNDHTPAPKEKKWHPDSNAAWYGHDEVEE